MYGTVWTRDDVNTLCAEVSAGHSSHEIAGHLRRSVEDVEEMAAELRLDRRPAPRPRTPPKGYVLVNKAG